ncbi:DUF805 domain-containing protein [Methyloligella sp. 2.7D]|uniref:DUF805 domain-containing protein n=1 Tax=unclassified Methyloligella TaxID=2625955 RepID=UPI00157C7347|nr:DUF805 domain-containing protein [Methyloligella sp. GL2]QKP78554.1 DUF805 domain-containing protein [Methyloligella sp. GL2]
MDLKFLYLASKGRISRKTFLLALIGLMAAAYAASFIVQWMAGTLAGNELMGRLASGMMMVIVVAFLVGLISICVKRFHDRNRSAWWMAPLYVVSIVSVFALSANQGVPAEGIANFGMAVHALWLGIVLWMLLELGILKGTAGPNQFGPDPLARPEDDAG